MTKERDGERCECGEHRERWDSAYGAWACKSCGTLAVKSHRFLPYANRGEPPRYARCSVCGVLAKDHGLDFDPGTSPHRTEQRGRV
jgi:hypothetical protein